MILRKQIYDHAYYLHLKGYLFAQRRLQRGIINHLNNEKRM